MVLTTRNNATHSTERLCTWFHVYAVISRVWNY